MIIGVLLLFQAILHPFHVSVSEIKYKADARAIQISTRIFLDDLEMALKTYSAREKLDITDEKEWNFVNSQLEQYVAENLQLIGRKGVLESKYIGAEIEDDVMWIYVEIEKVRKLETITVRNSLLTETFDDQENLVHFRAFDKVKSARFYKEELEKKFEWN